MNDKIRFQYKPQDQLKVLTTALSLPLQVDDPQIQKTKSRRIVLLMVPDL